MCMPVVNGVAIGTPLLETGKEKFIICEYLRFNLSCLQVPSHSSHHCDLFQHAWLC